MPLKGGTAGRGQQHNRWHFELKRPPDAVWWLRISTEASEHPEIAQSVTDPQAAR